MPRAPESEPGAVRSQDASSRCEACSGSRQRRARGEFCSAARASNGRNPLLKLQRLAQAAVKAFREKYPPTTPMIVGNIEEVRIDDKDHELYCQ